MTTPPAGKHQTVQLSYIEKHQGNLEHHTVVYHQLSLLAFCYGIFLAQDFYS